MTWGDQIEDRDSQISYSALGKAAPINEKKKWNPGFEKRKQIKKNLDKTLKGLAVNMGGVTFMVITKSQHIPVNSLSPVAMFETCMPESKSCRNRKLYRTKLLEAVAESFLTL